MATYNVFGLVKSHQSNVGIEGLKVELYDDENNSVGVPDVTTDANGRFQFITDMASSSLIFRFKVTNEDGTTVFLSPEDSFNWTPDYTGEIVLFVDATPVRSISISGIVSDKRGIPMEGMTLKFHEAGFRTTSFINQTTTDVNGFYSTVFKTSELANYKPGLTQINVLGAFSTDPPVVDVTFYLTEDTKHNVNLSANEDFDSDTISFDNIIDAINTSIGSADIDSLTDEEIEYVSRQLSKNKAEIRTIVNAHKFATETSTEPQLFYALLKKTGIVNAAINPMVHVQEGEIRDAVAEAIETKTINTFAPHEIDAFVDAALDYKTENLKEGSVRDEVYTTEDVLMSIFNSGTDVTDFLRKVNEEGYDNLDAFWTAYESAYGSTKLALAQKGMMLATITGHQPETISHLLTVLGTDEVYTLANWTKSTWVTTVNTICTTNSKLCVPVIIRGDETDPGNTDIQTAYAESLMKAVQGIYPLVRINFALQGSEGNLIIADNDARSAVITFLTNNPYFDIRRIPVHDINATDQNLSGISDVDILKDALGPLQRLLRITIGLPLAVIRMLKDGVHSAKSIIDMGETAFIEAYTTLLGDEETAATIYSRADTIYTLAEHYVLNTITNNNVAGAAPVMPYMNINEEEGGGNPIAEATISTMFGSFDYCKCSQCMSMYSPSAYFTDIMNFLRLREPVAYAELLRRRLDIRHIDLTCKNTNTPLPYVDLVIEQIEKMIYEKVLPVPNEAPPFLEIPFPNSFQTDGSASSIAAYAEHKYRYGNYLDYSHYKVVYGSHTINYGTTPFQTFPGVLNNAIYPNNLPFSLATEETRTYMSFLGSRRNDVMRLFKPYNTPLITATNELSDYAIIADAFDLTKEGADIITKSHSESANTYKFYGFSMASGTQIQNWPDPENTGAVVTFPSPNNPTPNYLFLLTNRLDVLLIQAGITYQELLEFLNTDFLNPLYTPTPPALPHQKVNIVSGLKANGTPADTATCRIPELKLSFNADNVITPQIFLEKLYRFVRLYRTEKMSVYQWDILMKSFNMAELDASSKPSTNGTYTDFELLGKAYHLSNKLKIAPEILAAWWSNLNTTSYIDYSTDRRDFLPSVYATIFDNRGVINDPSYDIFGNYKTIHTYTYQNNFTTLAALLSINESDLTELFSFLGLSLTDNMNVTAISRMYIIGRLAGSLKLSVSELITIMQLAGIKTLLGNILTNPPHSSSPVYTYSTYIDTLYTIIDAAEAIRDSGFALDEINYLVRNDDPSSNWHPQSLTIQSFYEDLRTELLKLPLYVAPPSSPSAADIKTATALLKPLVDTIYQVYSKHFSIPESWVMNMLDPSGYPTTSSTTSNSFTMRIVQQALFRTVGSENDLAESVSAMQVFYDKYRLIHKITFTSQVLKLTNLDFKLLYLSGLNSGGPVNFNFDNLPVTVDSSFVPEPLVVGLSSIFNGFLRICRLIEIRDRLKLKDNAKESGLATWLNLNYAASTTTDKENEKGKWLSFFKGATDWGNLLTELVGAKTELNPPTVGAITNLLRLTFPTDFTPNSYKNLSLILRINTIQGFSKRSGLGAVSLHKSLRPDVSLDDSRNIIFAAKGRQNESSWELVAKPLRDTIRVKQRDALVAYALANPPVGNKYPWRNKGDLYEYFMMDVETEPVVKTSRIKQAINSIQLFINRVIMNLEYEGGDRTKLIRFDPTFIRQWRRWRKWYGVWQVNRELFLYPENWLEPTLRDDRTEIFKELQTELLQADITDETAERAFNNYLLKLNDVANLEIVGCVEHVDAQGRRQDIDGNKVVHVFGRTYGEPRVYYYRKLVNKVWTGWEKMETEILSDHIMPVCWRGRLYVFWASFLDKKISAVPGPTVGFKDPGGYNYIVNTKGGNHSMWFYNDPLSVAGEPDPNEKDPKYYHQLEIALNWTEFHDGKWEKTRVASDRMRVTLNPYLNTDFVKTYLETTTGGKTSGLKNFYQFLTKNFKMSFTELTKSRFFMHHEFIKSKHPVTQQESDSLVVHMLFPNSYVDTNEPGMQHIQAFYFANPSTDPVVWNEAFSSVAVVSPHTTVNRDMNFVYNPNNLVNGNGKLYRDNGVSTHMANRYVYSKEGTAGVFSLIRYGYDVLLNNTPGVYGNYKVKAKSNFLTYPLENHFAYTDNVNSFFARRASPDPIIPMVEPSNYYFLGDAQGASFSSLYKGSLTVLYTIGSGKRPTILPVIPSFPMMKTMAEYYFQTFYHPYAQQFLQALYAGGLDTLFDLRMQVPRSKDNMKFFDTYSPTSLILNGKYLGNPKDTEVYLYPTDHVDFSYMAAYSVYNWELFYHIPMLIAQSLSTNQKFEEAQKWYHYIFDPTSNTDENGAYSSTRQRFWKCRPFYEMSSPTKSIQTLSDLLLEISKGNTTAVEQVTTMQQSPLQPYAVARLRQLAFMKNTVLKYIENLIAWGDQLFTRNTIESINEATQLYVLAENILGKRPTEVPPRAESVIHAFYNLTSSSGTSSGVDAFSNALVSIEHYIDINARVDRQNKPPYAPGKIFYFCIPENREMLKHWDTIADRLFKIRNSLNIKGQLQKLPLFEPPINPALLVRAAAAGIDISTVLDNISGANLTNYRFSYYLQKSNEICNDVKALGNALLSALEKKDAEEMALLRSSLEKTLLEKTLAFKKSQVEEAKAALEPLYKAQLPIHARIAYYSSRQKQIAEETEYFSLVNKSLVHSKRQLTFSMIGAAVSLIPQMHLQATFAIGASFGGQQLNTIFQALSTRQGFKASENMTRSGMSTTKAGIVRRWDDWQFQVDLASKELEPIYAQIIAAEARIETAEKDLEAFQVQIDNNKAIDAFMRSKYTNKELYSWMISQISTTYFQSYQFAFRQVQTALSCYEYELPFAFLDKKRDQIIQFGYWDSLRKGLLAAEQLQLDLRKLEIAYAEDNKREYELTKHISLANLDPLALLELRETGQCTFDTENWMFDMDFPGHYFRRIKSVSLSIPCVAGPYTTIGAQLTLNGNTIYKEDGSVFRSSSIGDTIATSSSQNDSGLFELNFRDDRYLPFEGKGVIGNWSMNLVQEEQLRQFDYTSISDVIVHIKYTSQGGYDADVASDTVNNIKGSQLDPLPRIFSLKHDFSNAWNSGFSAFTQDDALTANVGRSMSMILSHDQFPFYCKGKQINIVGAAIKFLTSEPGEDTKFMIETWKNGMPPKHATSNPLIQKAFTDGNEYANSVQYGSSAGLSLQNGDTREIRINMFKTDNSGAVDEDFILNKEDLQDVYIVFNYYLTDPS